MTVDEIEKASLRVVESRKGMSHLELKHFVEGAD